MTRVRRLIIIVGTFLSAGCSADYYDEQTKFEALTHFAHSSVVDLSRERKLDLIGFDDSDAFMLDGEMICGGRIKIVSTQGNGATPQRKYTYHRDKGSSIEGISSDWDFRELECIGAHPASFRWPDRRGK